MPAAEEVPHKDGTLVARPAPTRESAEEHSSRGSSPVSVAKLEASTDEAVGAAYAQLYAVLDAAEEAREKARLKDALQSGGDKVAMRVCVRGDLYAASLHESALRVKRREILPTSRSCYGCTVKVVVSL